MIIRDQDTASTGSHRFYHVRGESYTPGTDLLCADAVFEQGLPRGERLYDTEGLDADMISLFETLEDAQDYIQEFPNRRWLMIIDLPSNPHEWGLTMTVNAEGYPGVIGKIDAQWITHTTDLAV